MVDWRCIHVRSLLGTSFDTSSIALNTSHAVHRRWHLWIWQVDIRTGAFRKLKAPRIELDALHWLPNWAERDKLEFLSLVAKATEGDRWVVDGNYSFARDLLWPKQPTSSG